MGPEGNDSCEAVECGGDAEEDAGTSGAGVDDDEGTCDSGRGTSAGSCDVDSVDSIGDGAESFSLTLGSFLAFSLSFLSFSRWRLASLSRSFGVIAAGGSW
jgi:hypothetical protein